MDEILKGSLSKLGSMIVAALITAIIGIPIAYFVVRPLTPKPNITIGSLIEHPGGYSDNNLSLRVNNNSSLPAKDVLVAVSFVFDNLADKNIDILEVSPGQIVQ